MQLSPSQHLGGEKGLQEPNNCIQLSDGLADGLADRLSVGEVVGLADGLSVGLSDGFTVGSFDGCAVGLNVASTPHTRGWS